LLIGRERELVAELREVAVVVDGQPEHARDLVGPPEDETSTEDALRLADQRT
jgi:hypothetical protein